MYPYRFEGVLRIETVEGVHACVCMLMMQKKRAEMRNAGTINVENGTIPPAQGRVW